MAFGAMRLAGLRCDPAGSAQDILTVSNWLKVRRIYARMITAQMIEN